MINQVLNLDNEKSLETGLGKPCTLDVPKYYESITIPFLRLTDSRGTEKEKYGHKEIKESNNKFINTQIKSGDPDKFVHCKW